MRDTAGNLPGHDPSIQKRRTGTRACGLRHCRELRSRESDVRRLSTGIVRGESWSGPRRS
jgi:hypothetical protein